jgi:parallel beta-helix repeat protein
MNTTPRSIRPSVLAVVLLFTGGLVAIAGPLNPPAGPVAPSYKTLSQVEPRIEISTVNTPGDANSLYKITQAGSYYLTGNITGVAAKHGIEIAVGGVSLDLMGFELVGVAGSLDGVTIPGQAGLRNIRISNGVLRGWNQGVNLFDGASCSLLDIRSSGNASSGIAGGNGAVVTRCSASVNGGMGISCQSGCTLTECAASGNTLNGINAAGGCVITGCSAFGNLGDGITTQTGCTITGCSTYSNVQNGINAGSTSTVSNCSTRQNTLDGVRVASGCVVLASTCALNGNSTSNGAGIHATGADNRIEGNNCTGADLGIDVDSAGNLIVRNSCSGNTINWVLVAGNVFGPILDRTAPGSAAVSGNSAPDTTASTSPNANFSY